jgi:hypothetical protein
MENGKNRFPLLAFNQTLMETLVNILVIVATLPRQHMDLSLTLNGGAEHFPM